MIKEFSNLTDRKKTNKKNRSFSLLIFLGVFIVVQRPPSNSQVIHLLANHFLLIFSVPIIVHNFFKAFLQIMVSSVVNWKIPFQALEFSLINKGMCQRQTRFAILLKCGQNFVYRTQMTYNKGPLRFQFREKSAWYCFMVFVLLFYVICVRYTTKAQILVFTSDHNSRTLEPISSTQTS